MFELYVVLSDLCNFSCDHCINSSGPQSKRWRISPDELEQLAQLVNHDSNIVRIHFSGGEPTLHVNQIQKLQSAITRPVEYGMTSNGWLGKRIEQLLSEVSIQQIILSYDKYHAPFVTKATLLDFIDAVQKRQTSIKLNFVFDAIEDLLELDAFSKTGIEIETCKLIRSGRGKGIAGSAASVHDYKNKAGTCPSIGSSPSLEKIIYVPGRGLTPCCGPLVFDELIPAEKAFSNVTDDYNRNPLRQKLLTCFSDSEEAKTSNWQALAFNSKCEACVWLYSDKRRDHKLDVASLSLQKEATKYYHTESPLDDASAFALSKKFIVSHVLSNSLELPAEPESERPKDISVFDLDDNSEIDRDEIERFVRRNYYEAHSSYFSNSEIETLPQSLSEYLAIGATGRAYRKNGQIVALILHNFYETHPGLKIQSSHIGYWGYDPNSIKKYEARWIKGDWTRFLATSHSLAKNTDCSIEWFNRSSYALAIKLGFQLRMIRLDRREQ